MGAEGGLVQPPRQFPIVSNQQVSGSLSIAQARARSISMSARGHARSPPSPAPEDPGDPPPPGFTPPLSSRVVTTIGSAFEDVRDCVNEGVI